MPDTPDIGPTRASTHDPRERAWREAFAGLELETPAGDGWPRLAALLPMAGSSATPAAVPRRHPRGAGRRGHRRLAWLAVAATLVLSVGVPLKLLHTRPENAPASPSPTAAPGIAPTDERLRATADGDASHSVPSGARQEGRPDPQQTGAMAPSIDMGPDGTGIARQADAPARRDPSSGPAPANRTALRERDLAATRHRTVDAVAAPTGNAFDRLYGESARLEAMVALARDDGMSSATAATMTAAIDARIGRIDASLSQPDLLPDARLRLWQARVQALRELAGLETTQRLMASQGRDYDATLVRVD